MLYRKARQTVAFTILLVLVAFLVTSYGLFQFRAHRAIAASSSEQIMQWQRINDQVHYLYTLANAGELTKEALVEGQGLLLKWTHQAQELEKSLSAMLLQTRHQRDLLWISEKQEVQLYAAIPEAYKSMIDVLKTSSQQEVLAGAGFLRELAVESGTSQLLQPLHQRQQLLEHIQARFLRRIWLVFGVLSAMLLAGTLFLWSRILRPGIDQLEISLKQVRVASEARLDEFVEQEKHRRSEKMQAIKQLAGGIAHDFNNMLAGISGATEHILLTESNRFMPKSRDYLDSILATTQRAAAQTEKLTNFAGNAIEDFEQEDVSLLLDEAVQVCKNTLRSNIRYFVNNKLQGPHAICRSRALKHMFVNMMTNAAQAMPEGGRISIELSNLWLDQSQCDATGFEMAEGDFIRVLIADEGPGIDPQLLEQIFNPYFTTWKLSGGTGLGLSSAHGTVTDHDGAIQVFNLPEGGAEFSILLPATTPLASEQEPDILHSVDSPASDGQGLVLLVDDEELLLEVGRGILEHLGFAVLTASDGEQAIDLYFQHQQDINLVVLDMNMPVMGGYETLCKLKAVDPSCNVVIATGYSSSTDLEMVKEAGAEHILHKPYEIRKIASVTEQALQTMDEETVPGVAQLISACA